MTQSLIAGVDEAGRGAWAGNVVVAAVILPNHYKLHYLNDSKKLTPKRREILCESIFQQAISVSYAQICAATIDKINILQATMKAMSEAIAGLSVAPKLVLVDGNSTPKLSIPCRAIIGGDGIEPAISAASIIAKVMRDRQMIVLDNCYPDYRFTSHKGYGTKIHQLALAEHGIIERVHRKSYAPIARLLTALI